MLEYPTVDNPTFTQWLKWKLSLSRQTDAVSAIGGIWNDGKSAGWPSRARSFTPFAVWLKGHDLQHWMPTLSRAFFEYERDMAEGKAIPAFRVKKAAGPHRDRRSFTILPDTYERVRELCESYDPPISQGAVIDKAIASLHARRKL
jgi:hypothetical protein